MSGPFGSSQFMYATGAAEEGQSLRFEDGNSPYLSLTPSSAGNQDVWTFSAWVKRGNIGSIYPTIFAAGTTTTDRFLFRFSADKLDVFWRDGNTTNRTLTTNALYRDCSAWYHVVLAVDTTDATTANRMRLYVNGDEVTSFSADNRSTLSSGSTLAVNDAVLHTIGTRAYSVGNYYEGYIANACFIDGQQLDPTSFGEYKNTLWKPKSDADVQALTFGTNGWYLNFADTTSLTTLGDDTSGNGNDWTTSGITLNVAPSGDAPVLGGNFCVLDPNYSHPTLSYGNLVHYDATAGWTSAAGTFSVSSGKWYYEYMISNVNNTTTFILNGWAKIGSSNVVSNLSWYPGSTATSYGLFTTGAKYNNATNFTYGSAQVNGDIVGVALDLDAGTLTYYVNGVSQGTAFSGLSGEFFPAIGTYGGVAILNFGQDGFFSGNKTSQGNTDANGLGDFYHTVPTGHLALVSANLPTPAITAPDEYFNTVLYTGTGSAQSVTGVNHQPDLIWVKNRDVGGVSYYHNLYDSVRGINSGGSPLLDSSSTAAEITGAGYGVAGTSSDGFDLIGAGTLSNESGKSYVAWNWLANGTGVSNTSGSITSTVSANQTAGFSIVTFTSPATSSTAFTVGHGLSSAPEMIITKERDGTLGWLVYHDELPSPKDNYLLLNSSSGQAGTVTDCWGTSAPTSSVFGMKTTVSVGTSKSTIGYCFHSVEGYSKVGSYTGNYSTDGTFVHCGFRPAFLMMKRTDATGSSWIIIDSKRNPENVVDANLFPNGNFQEDSTSGYLEADFLANGVKLRSQHGAANDSGVVYIFYAVAEAPFKSANAR